MIFDTHAHYDDEAFDADREEILAGLYSRGIDRVANVGVDIPTCENTLALADKYDFIYAVIGFHPSDTKGMPEGNLDWLRAHVFADPLAAEQAFSDVEMMAVSQHDTVADSAVKNLPRNKKVVAIGEIGLDYHWSESEEENQNQQRWFRRQIQLARELNLPIVVHSREAAADTMSIIRDEKAYENSGIIHCYSYSVEQAREYVKMGFMIGVGGVITFKNSRRLRETVEQIPLENIVLETDCPYLAPEPHRGRRNDSSLLPLVVNAIAEIKRIPPEGVVSATTHNSEKVYRIK